MCSKALSLVAVCAPGLENFVLKEVVRLGFLNPIEEPGGVSFEFHEEHLYRANLHLSMATHVLLRIGNFHARTFYDLVKNLGEIDFSPWILDEQRLGIRATSTNSLLWHQGAIEERAYNVIYKQLGKSKLEKDEKVSRAQANVIVRMKDDFCNVNINTSGIPLFKRGYRLASTNAPLREDLARAAIEAVGWDTNTPFLDPMCGSGTIGIEAALYGSRTPPGWNRVFDFMKWKNFNPYLWANIRKDAFENITTLKKGLILCSDRDAGASMIAYDNARRASVDQYMDFEECSLSAALNYWGYKNIDLDNVTLITNPPSTNRNKFHKHDPTRLYQTLGDVVRKNCGEKSRIGVMQINDRKMSYRIGLPMRSGWMSTQSGRQLWCMIRRMEMPLWSFVKELDPDEIENPEDIDPENPITIQANDEFETEIAIKKKKSRSEQ